MSDRPTVAEINKRIHRFRRAQSYDAKLRAYSPIIYLGRIEFIDLAKECHFESQGESYSYHGYVVIRVKLDSYINIAIDREF